ncbi:carboxypeptidase-like regulatory domain-containing protein [Aestuariivivens insulae]|uniref:carboxypeptidase-like regulatory domain-containing protein n=1 Tax=Aestuariivivens insulae TaxID=1621988 RepID=UPI001F5B013B|nr:carboxypeptidase-like regulatory domain-containing protein [Aestuariivivens insulae]
MKNLLLIAVCFVSAITFAQNKGTISGTLMDDDAINEPLVFAKVKVKETGAEVLSDDKGFFKLENLSEGTYTLVCSFVGYDSKAIKANIVNGKTSNVRLSLSASTISLDDLALTLASADNDTSTSNTSSVTQ